MRILVTGGAGFIGGHLVRLLTKEGHSVVVIDNFATGGYHNITNIHPSPIVRLVDCRDLDFYREVEDHGPFEFVFHLASTVGVFRVLKDPKQCIENNIEGFRSVVGLGVPGIFTSTSEVYGKCFGSLSEDSRILFSSKPRWAYATSKLICEWLALAAGWKVVRLFNVVGPGQSNSYGAVLPQFIKQALDGKPLTIFGDGEQTRTFINVKDCVRILHQLMDKQFDIVNVGGKDTCSINDLAHSVGEVFNHRIYSYVPYENAYGKGFEDCHERIPDLTKLYSLIGEPKNYTGLLSTIVEIGDHLKGVMPTESTTNTIFDTRAASVALHGK